MKNNKKIVFFLDHKHRDLFSTVKISNFLKEKNLKLKLFHNGNLMWLMILIQNLLF